MKERKEKASAKPLVTESSAGERPTAGAAGCEEGVGDGETVRDGVGDGEIGIIRLWSD